MSDLGKACRAGRLPLLLGTMRDSLCAAPLNNDCESSTRTRRRRPMASLLVLHRLESELPAYRAMTDKVAGFLAWSKTMLKQLFFITP